METLPISSLQVSRVSMLLVCPLLIQQIAYRFRRLGRYTSWGPRVISTIKKVQRSKTVFESGINGQVL